MDLKNIIAAITLSAAVIVLYGLFFAPTQGRTHRPFLKRSWPKATLQNDETDMR